MIRSLGHVCHWVQKGQEGVEHATHGSYDVILLDVMLPDLDGYDVVQELRRAKVHTPVIVQSGLVERDKAADALSMGVVDYLIKPYGKAEISARIDAVLARSPNGAEAPNGQSQLGVDTSERRGNSRVSVIKSGQIIYRASTCVMDTIILDISEHGAALQPEDPHRLPESFSLKIHHGPSYYCQVCWRYRNKVGVRFQDLKN